MTTKETPDYERMLTPREVAEIFNVGPRTVLRWALSGRLASVVTPGGHRRYRESQVREFLNSEE